MLNYLKNKWMAFRDIFKDDNDINEKSVVGFLSFAVMVIFAVVDLATGYLGKDLVINEFIYNSFVIHYFRFFWNCRSRKDIRKKRIKI
jgi:hypothetical protein